MMLRRRQALVASLSCTSLLFLLVFGGSRSPRSPAPPDGGPSLGAPQQLRSEAWSGREQLSVRGQPTSATAPLLPQSSPGRQSLSHLSSTQNEAEELPLKAKFEEPSLVRDQPKVLDSPPRSLRPATQVSKTESWKSISQEILSSRNSSANFNIGNSRVTSSENNVDKPQVSASSGARTPSSKVSETQTLNDASSGLSLGRAPYITEGEAASNSSDHQLQYSLKSMKVPLNEGLVRNTIDSDADFANSFVESNLVDSGSRGGYSTNKNNGTRSRKKDPQYVKRPLISNPKMYHYVPKRNAKAWASAYPQMLRSGVSTASYRVKFEYRNYPGELSFAPGGVVPKDKVKRILILTTWRSGSTFLGDIFNAYPGTFYSFEPLHELLQKQHLEDGPLKEPVLKHLRNLMTCSVEQDGFFDYVKHKPFLFSHNSRYWQSCSLNWELCFDAKFFNKVCEIMPVNVIKTVRMGAAPVEDLLADPSLDLRVIHLVRDPRGTLHSRLKLNWCTAPVCSDPGVVCQHLLYDLKCSESLQAKYPDRFLMVRYEDLGTQPEAMTSLILDFVGLPNTNSVKNFIAAHTTLENTRRKKVKNSSGEPVRRKEPRLRPTNAYSTFRDSRTTTFAWRNALNYSALSKIQSACEDPIRLLNLRIFSSESEYRNDNLTILLPENR